MRKNNKNFHNETDLAFTLAALLLNVLVLIVLCGSGWLLHSLITQNSLFNAVLNESMLR